MGKAKKPKQEFKFVLTCDFQRDEVLERMEDGRKSIEECLNDVYDHDPDLAKKLEHAADRKGETDDDQDHFLEESIAGSIDAWSDGEWIDADRGAEKIMDALIDALQEAGDNPKYPIVVKADI